MLEMNKCLDCGHYFDEPGQKVDDDLSIWLVCPLRECKKIKLVAMVESDKLTIKQAIENLKEMELLKQGICVEA